MNRPGPVPLWGLLLLFVIQCSCSTAPPASPRSAPLPSPTVNLSSPRVDDCRGCVAANTAAPSILVIVGNDPPTVDRGVPPGTSADSQVMKGVLGGAAAGAAGGALKCLPTIPTADPVSLLVALVVCPPVFMVVGATMGGAAASKQRVDTSVHQPQDVSVAVARSTGTAQRDLLKALTAYANANSVTMARPPAQSTVPMGNARTRTDQLPDSPDTTAIEVRILRFIPTQPDTVAVETAVRIITLPSRKVLDGYTVTRQVRVVRSGKSPADKASVDLTPAYREIAEAVLDETVLAYRGAGARSTAPRTQAPAEQPDPSRSGFPPYTLQPVATTHQATPTSIDSPFHLQWEPLPPSLTRDDSDRSNIHDVTYEVRLYDRTSELVYARDGLTAPAHVIDAKLLPCSVYFWTVRAHFVLAGQARATEWSGRYDPGLDPEDALAPPTAPKVPRSQLDPAWLRRNGSWSAGVWLPSLDRYPRLYTPARGADAHCVDQLGNQVTQRPVDSAPQTTASSAEATPTGSASRISLDPGPATPSAAPHSARASISIQNPALPKVGDTFTYNVLNGRRRVDAMTVAVAGLSSEGIVETLSDEKHGRLDGQRVFGLEFDPVRGFQERELPGHFFLAEFSPYAAPTQADIGKHWEGIQSRLTITLSGSVRESWRLSLSVVGTERIRVPAGEFDAIKVEAVSDSHRWADAGEGVVRMTFWYAPELKRTVKIVRRLDASKIINAYTDVYELASYTVN